MNNSTNNQINSFSMKKNYVNPKSEVIEMDPEFLMVNPASDIPVGGEGELDAPEYRTDWEKMVGR